MSIKSFIQSRSLLIYFILAYAISWGGFFLSFGPDGFKIFQGESVLSQDFSNNQSLIVWLAMLAGPSLAGLLLTGIADGNPGLKRLVSSILKWNVNIKWYIAALFITPTLLVLILYGLVFFSPDFSPGLMLGFGLAVGLIGGFFEEIGWTGFAQTKLQLYYSPLFAGIILGVIHAIWHFLADYWGGVSFYGEFYVLHFFLWIIALTAFRLLSVWIYNRSNSLLLAQLTHASFTGSQLVFWPSAVSAAESVIWYMVFTFALCIVVAIIIIKEKNSFIYKIRSSK